MVIISTVDIDKFVDNLAENVTDRMENVEMRLQVKNIVTDKKTTS